MIIKGIFRRYERWNPVHPTTGAFWGMGIGVGCGVGWGPGFGPEVIGYVGAGCGAGFSVGLTLAGIGLGLPANSLLQFPFTGTLRIAETALSPARDIVGERWKQMIPQIPPPSYGVDLVELMKPLTSFARPALECLDSFISCYVPPGRDPSKSSRRSKG